MQATCHVAMRHALKRAEGKVGTMYAVVSAGFSDPRAGARFHRCGAGAIVRSTVRMARHATRCARIELRDRCSRAGIRIRRSAALA